EESREFMDVAAKIRDHLKQIERFVESMPGCQEHLALIRKIPRVWKEKILIVEDMDYIAEFFKAVLSSEGSVEIASDGAEGLRKISETHFDVIVSDVDMPLVSGIEFYERAAQYDQKIGERFLFLSGDLTDQRRDFFLRNNLEFAAKPVSIDELRRRVAAIMKNNMKHF
ncbi:MAG: response regulator, partial [Thermodesulfovibrionales bacterium]